MNTLFWVYKLRLNSNQEAPLMLRITHLSKRSNINLQIRINPKQWDAKNQRAKGNDDKAVAINQLILQVQNRLLGIYTEFLRKGLPFSVKQIKDAYEWGDTSDTSLLVCFKEYLNTLRLRVSVDLAKASYIKYVTCYRKVERFITDNFNSSDISILQVDKIFINKLDLYLRVVKKNHNNTVVKNMLLLRTVFKFFQLNDWLHQDPFEGYKFKLKEVKRAYLTKEELKQLISVQPTTLRLQEVRDVFLFQCLTGLAHIDVYKLSKEHLIQSSEGSIWIDLRRTKTDGETRVPLLSLALEILRKYVDHPGCIKSGRLLPVIQNQPMNRALKDLAKEAGINKRLTSHMGRHAFATLVTLSNGMRIETVSKLLSHKNIRTTQIYAKVLDTQLTQEMNLIDIKMNLLQQIIE